MIKLSPLVTKPLTVPEPEKPKGAEFRVHGTISTILETEKEIVMLGTPADEEESPIIVHNCDWMGCGYDHVLWRYNKHTGALYGEGL
jgi:hypothetical protein